MRFREFVMIGLGLAILLATSSLALYYRRQAVSFEGKWNAAAAQLDRAAAASVTPPPMSASRKVETRTEKPAAQSSPADARPARPRRRQPEPQSATNDLPSPFPVAARAAPSPEPEQPRRRNSDWMENLRAADPDRYDEMQQRRRAMQQSIQNAWDQRTNYFFNRDTSKMTESEVEEYSTMVTLLTETWELGQQMRSGLPPDERRQVMTAVRSNVVVLAPLLDNERNREYYDMAVAMGHNEEDAAALVDYVNQITSNTSLRTVLPGVRGGGGPDRGMFRGDSPTPAPPAR